MAGGCGKGKKAPGPSAPRHREDWNEDDAFFAGEYDGDNLPSDAGNDDEGNDPPAPFHWPGEEENEEGRNSDDSQGYSWKEQAKLRSLDHAGLAASDDEEEEDEGSDDDDDEGSSDDDDSALPPKKRRRLLA